MRRSRLIAPWLEKIEEWVERYRGKVRADVVQGRLLVMDFSGNDRMNAPGGGGAQGCLTCGPLADLPALGCRSRECGCSSTGARVLAWADNGRTCSAPAGLESLPGGAGDLGPQAVHAVSAGPLAPPASSASQDAEAGPPVRCRPSPSPRSSGAGAGREAFRGPVPNTGVALTKAGRCG